MTLHDILIGAMKVAFWIGLGGLLLGFVASWRALDMLDGGRPRAVETPVLTSKKAIGGAE